MEDDKPPKYVHVLREEYERLKLSEQKALDLYQSLKIVETAYHQRTNYINNYGVGSARVFSIQHSAQLDEFVSIACTVRDQAEAAFDQHFSVLAVARQDRTS